MSMFGPRHSSPTTTVLADGYTDDALGSKYDNYRASRPYSRESLLSGTSFGSKVRLSQFSLLSRPDATLAEEEGDDENITSEYLNRREQKKILQAHVLKMFAGNFSSPVGSLDMEDHYDLEQNATVIQPPPKSFLGKCKYYYDKYKLHRIAACVCLILYAFLGAWLFYVIEHEYEKEVKGKEKIALRSLRNDTYQKISKMMARGNSIRFEDILVEYEKEAHKVRLPECLDWDYWGALFYVGTLFTTIGYGNIAPRTATGRALSIIYAIIGIPLVLAILSKCGKWLTTTLSIHWQQHRRNIKVKAKKTTNRLRGRKMSIIESIENGLNPNSDSDIDIPESRTIPVWLALLICILFVCGCSSLFLIWETRWTFFTSLYFFCISLSTIGLGDIVPDHPHMFIIMFVLVILGLSIVSMLISVIQIKMEEWLYHLIKKIQQEYNRALENGEEIDRNNLLRNVMSNEPAWMQLVAPTMLTGQQADKLEQKVDQFERLLKESKDVQTDLSVAFAGTQVEKYDQSMACDPMSQRIVPQHRETQWSNQPNGLVEKEPEEAFLNMNVASRSDYRDSISDATSLPMDSISSPEMVRKEKGKRNRECQNCNQKMNTDVADGGAQTDLAQFQIDEIAIKLASLQTQRVRPPIVERSMETSLLVDSPLSSQSEEILRKNGLSQSDINVICEAMTSSFYKNNLDRLVDCAVGSDMETTSFQDRSQNTSQIETLGASSETQTDNLLAKNNKTKTKKQRSINTSPLNSISSNHQRENATSPIPFINIIDDETQTSLREQIDVPTETENLVQVVNRSTATSPVHKKLMNNKETGMSISEKVLIDRMVSPIAQSKRDHNTSPHLKKEDDSDSAEFNDRSMQTSIGEWFGKFFQKSDQSQQTSISDDNSVNGNKSKKMKENKKNKKKNIGSDKDDNSQTSLGSDELVSSPSTSEDLPSRKSSDLPTVMTSSVTMSTQYSPPPGCDSLRLFEGTHRARSSSTSGMGTSIFEEENRQEVIVQTDDSYLKIARRLDEYRNNKTQFLPVCAAAPLLSKEVEPFKEDRPSERSHYYFGSRRQSLGRSSRKPSRQEMSHREAQTGQSMDADILHDALNSEKSRSISPSRSLNSRKLTRNPSLPVGISRGKVFNYVSQHEKGIPNPATNRQSPVKIIRQYSLDQ